MRHRDEVEMEWDPLCCPKARPIASAVSGGPTYPTADPTRIEISIEKGEGHEANSGGSAIISSKSGSGEAVAQTGVVSSVASSLVIRKRPLRCLREMIRRGCFRQAWRAISEIRGRPRILRGDAVIRQWRTAVTRPAILDDTFTARALHRPFGPSDAIRWKARTHVVVVAARSV